MQFVKRAFGAVKSAFKKTGHLAVAGLVTLGAASQSHAAATTPIDDLFAAVDIDNVQSLVLAMGITVVAIALVFVGIKLVKRALRSI